MRISSKESAVSPVVGIAVLIAIAVILSALVFATTSGFMTEQQAPSAGANVTIVSESVIQVQLDSVQNADNVYVQSPLGTRYKFDGVGDTVEILNIGNEQKPVVIAEKDGKEHVIQGITPRSFDADYVVSNGGMSLSDAVSAASPGETIAIKRGTYSGNVDVDKDVKIVAETGTEYSGTISISVASTVSNITVKTGSIDVQVDGPYLASNQGNINENGYNVARSDSTNALLRETEKTSSPNSAPSVSFNISPETPTVGDSVSFDASGSSDSDGSITSYSWDFDGDNEEDATSVNPSYTFSSAGEKTVSLTVTDDDGSSTSTSNTVSVKPIASGNLVAHYKLDVDGAEAISSNDGVINGSPSTSQGVVDSALKFDGDVDYIDVSHSYADDFGSSSFSTSVWFKTTKQTGNQPIVDNRDEGSGFVGFVLSISDGKPTMWIDNGSTNEVAYEANNSYADGSWHHMTVMRDNNADTLRLFIDGNEKNWSAIDGGSASSYGSIAHSKNTQIGAQYVDYGSPYVATKFKGLLDDVRLYDKALSSSEVQALYDSGNIPPAVEFTSSPSTPAVGEMVTVDASQSTDSDGSISSYSWDFDGDGQEDATGKTATHTFGSTGDHNVTLTVVDNGGKSASNTKIVTVEPKERIVDDFEDGDISEWAVINTVGPDPQVSSTAAFSGSFGFEADTRRVDLYSNPGDGLKNYPEQGDTITAHWYYGSDSEGQENFGWGVQNDASDWTQLDKYTVSFKQKYDKVQIDKWKNGISTNLSSKSVNWDAYSGEWLQMNIHWRTNGDITIKWYDEQDNKITEITAHDDEYSTGGIAISKAEWGKDNSYPTYVDEILIK